MIQAVNDNFAIIDAHKKNLTIHSGTGGGGDATPAVPFRVTIPSGTTFRCQNGFTLNENTTLIVESGFSAGVSRSPLTIGSSSFSSVEINFHKSINHPPNTKITNLGIRTFHHNIVLIDNIN